MSKTSKKVVIIVSAVLVLIAVELVLAAVFISKMSNRGRRQSPGRSRHPAPEYVQPAQQEPPRRSTKSKSAPVVSTPRPKAKPTGPRVAAPQFSKTSGVFSDTFTVALKATAKDAVIRYTLDGSEPGESSAVYSEPIPITQTTLLRACAFQKELAPSATVTATYTLVDESARAFTSNLPIIILNSFGQYIGPDNYIPASFRYIDRAGSRAALTGPGDFDGRGDIKRRGYSSLRLPKPSFTFKARNDDGDKLKFSPSGLPTESDWVLYAPYSDKTLMRDALAYELSNKMGRYAPRTRFVEVFLARPNSRLSARDNLGVYVLVEKIKRGKDRVNIAKIEPDDLAEPDITGGYIFKRDHGASSGGGRGGRGGNWGGWSPRASDDGVGFKTPRDLHLFFVDPNEKELTKDQRDWLARYVGRFESTLHGQNFAHPENGYAKYLDVDAFIDHHWLVEMSKNIDAFRYSAYLYKPRNGKITMGPCWDWNLSFGNADYYDAYETTGWYYTWLRDTEIAWFDRLREDPEFHQRHIDRWAVLRRDVFAPENILRRVDEMAAELKEAQARNFQRWRILGRYVQPNYYSGPTFEAEVEWMKQWIKNRIAWIDRQFPRAPTLSEKPGRVPAGALLTLTGSSGKIYYTLDGTDPRAPGGTPARNAREYTDPIPIKGDTRLVARSVRSSVWSGPTEARFTTSPK